MGDGNAAAKGGDAAVMITTKLARGCRCSCADDVVLAGGVFSARA